MLHGDVLEMASAIPLPLSPESPRSIKSQFRKGGRSYMEAASVEFDLASPRSSGEFSAITGASGCPAISDAALSLLSPRVSRRGNLRRSTRIMIDFSIDGADAPSKDR